MDKANHETMRMGQPAVQMPCTGCPTPLATTERLGAAVCARCAHMIDAHGARLADAHGLDPCDTRSEDAGPLARILFVGGVTAFSFGFALVWSWLFLPLGIVILGVYHGLRVELYKGRP